MSFCASSAPAPTAAPTIGLAMNSTAAPAETLERQRRLHAHVQPLRLLREVDVAVDRHRRRRSGQLQVVRVHLPVLDAEVAGDVVEREALAEDVAEVERDAPRQRLQRQHAQQLADARIDLRELAGPGLQLEAAGQRRIVEVVGRAGPAQTVR